MVEHFLAHGFKQMTKANPRTTVKKNDLSVVCYPLTPDRWEDVEQLFGNRGACGGCWCMAWRLKRAVFNAQKGEANRAAFRAIVRRGEVPGILAYAGNTPVGWCAIAPRSIFPALGNSRVLSPVDNKPVWSITCFFIEKPWRRKGLSSRLIEGAIKMARDHGAETVEAYPNDLKKGNLPDAFVWTGLASAFLKVGFREVARRSSQRPILRLDL